MDEESLPTLFENLKNVFPKKPNSLKLGFMLF